MKVLLSTIVDNINYGTYLQVYATVKLLMEKGCEVDVLNYTRPFLNYGYWLNQEKKKGVRTLLRSLFRIAMDAYMKKNVKKFLQEKVHLTPHFSNWIAFRDSLPDYDLYMVGSDQVWNTIHNHGVDGVFFFEGISGKKVAYASSIGTKSIPESDSLRIKKLLEGFSHISVRENFGVEALKRIGLDNVAQVLDPTLMLTKKDWEKICDKPFEKKEPYLLVYSVEVNKDKGTIELARKIASDRGLKLYLISPYIKFNSKLKVDKLFSLADTDTFLGLFLNADYSVVSSFHGTAFAINFGCQFVTVAPDKFSSRVESILKLLNLEDRYIKNIDEIPNSDIDFTKVNSLLNHYRKESENIFVSFLGK